VAYGREKYGSDFWRKVTSEAAAFNGLFYPLQQAIRKYSGKTYREFRKEAMEFFKTRLEVHSPPGTDSPLSVPEHFVSNEEYPNWIDTSSVLFMKSSYDRIPEFMVNVNGIDKKI